MQVRQTQHSMRTGAGMELFSVTVRLSDIVSRPALGHLPRELHDKVLTDTSKGEKYMPTAGKNVRLRACIVCMGQGNACTNVCKWCKYCVCDANQSIEYETCWNAACSLCTLCHEAAETYCTNANLARKLARERRLRSWSNEEVRINEEENEEVRNTDAFGDEFRRLTHIHERGIIIATIVREYEPNCNPLT